MEETCFPLYFYWKRLENLRGKCVEWPFFKRKTTPEETNEVLEFGRRYQDIGSCIYDLGLDAVKKRLLENAGEVTKALVFLHLDLPVYIYRIRKGRNVDIWSEQKEITLEEVSGALEEVGSGLENLISVDFILNEWKLILDSFNTSGRYGLVCSIEQELSKSTTPDDFRRRIDSQRRKGKIFFGRIAYYCKLLGENVRSHNPKSWKRALLPYYRGHPLDYTWEPVEWAEGEKVCEVISEIWELARKNASSEEFSKLEEKLESPAEKGAFLLFYVYPVHVWKKCTTAAERALKHENPIEFLAKRALGRSYEYFFPQYVLKGTIATFLPGDYELERYRIFKDLWNCTQRWASPKPF